MDTGGCGNECIVWLVSGPGSERFDALVLGCENRALQLSRVLKKLHFNATEYRPADAIRGAKPGVDNHESIAIFNCVQLN